MPVNRRACDYCRAHKLKCEWLEQFSSCGKCRSRSQPCVMPPSPPGASAGASYSSYGATQTAVVDQGSVSADSDASYPTDVDGRIQHLETFIEKLKQTRPVTSPSSAPKKRTYDQGAGLEETPDHNKSISPAVNIPRPAYLQQLGKRRAIGVDLIGEPQVSQPVVLVKCKRGNCYLPLPEEGSALLNEFLHDFNATIPLFHPETIYNHVRACYSDTSDGTPLAWVLTYVALGIGHRLRAMSLFAAPNDTPNGDYYLNKCLAVLPDLLLQDPSLLLIQALLGVSVLLQTSERSRKAPLFVSTAMRMSQELGYNEAGCDGFTSDLDRQENNIFWLAFHFDTSMNFASNRPNTQRLADISAPLPSATSTNWWATDTSSGYSDSASLNYFAMHAGLAVIQAEAMEELYSVQARRRSVDVLARAFDNIDYKLQIWRQRNPLAQLDAQALLKAMYRSDVVHSIALEASYFGTLYHLHATRRLGAMDDRREERLNVYSESELLIGSNMACQDLYLEANRLLEFSALISQGTVSVTWIALEATIPALCTALSYANNPANSSPTTQTRLYKDALDSLEQAAAITKDPKLTSKVNVCKQLYTMLEEKVWND